MEEMIPEAPVNLHAEEESIDSEELGSGDVAPPDSEPAEDGTEVEPAPASVDEVGEKQVEIVGGSTPNEASSEWPSADAPVRVWSYYFVKMPRKLKNEDLKSELQDKTDKRDSIAAAVKLKREQRQEILNQLAEPQSSLRAINEDIKSKIAEMGPMQGDLRDCRTKLPDSCESEKELNEQIAEKEYALQHETLPLQIEKQYLRDLQKLKSSRSTVVKKEFLKEQLKPLQDECNELKKSRELLNHQMEPLEKQSQKLFNEIKELQAKKSVATGAVNEVSGSLNENSDFIKNRNEIANARKHALNRDRQAVEELCHAQVERYMALYCENARFRSEYVANNASSTERRLGTADGRSVGVNEEPPVREAAVEPVKEAPKPAKAEVVKAEAVKAKAEAAGKAKSDAAVKAKSDAGVKVKGDAAGKGDAAVKAKGEAAGKAKSEAVVEAEAPEAEEEVVDEERERERRRQESMEKSKLAEARKKKQAEKKAAKNAVRLEKEKQRKEMKKQRKRGEEATSNSTEGENGVVEAPEEAAVAVADAGAVAGAVEANGNVEEGAEVIKAGGDGGAGSRRRRGGGKAGKSSAVRPPFKKKRSLQRQILDNWQLILAALLVVLAIAGVSMAFVRV